MKRKAKNLMKSLNTLKKKLKQNKIKNPINKNFMKTNK